MDCRCQIAPGCDGEKGQTDSTELIWCVSLLAKSSTLLASPCSGMTIDGAFVRSLLLVRICRCGMGPCSSAFLAYLCLLLTCLLAYLLALFSMANTTAVLTFPSFDGMEARHRHSPRGYSLSFLEQSSRRPFESDYRSFFFLSLSSFLGALFNSTPITTSLLSPPSLCS